MAEDRVLCSFSKDAREILKTWELYLRLTCIETPMRHTPSSESIHALVVDKSELKDKISECWKYGYDPERDWLFGIIDGEIPKFRFVSGFLGFLFGFLNKGKIILSGPTPTIREQVDIKKQLENRRDIYLEYHSGKSSDNYMIFLGIDTSLAKEYKKYLLNPRSYRIESLKQK
jgi:hypothetical protein